MAEHAASYPPHEPPSRSPLQFSLTALFILTTVFALTLSAFFAISRLAGMSALELLMTSSSQLIYSVPRIIIWSVGLSMAIRRRHTHRKAAMLTATAMIGLIVALLLLMTLQTAIIAGMNSGQFANWDISWIFAAIGVVYTLADVVCWILILMAIFSDRPVTRSPFGVQTDVADPFARQEPPTTTPIDDEPSSGSSRA